jgi:hypothetical protein
MFDYDWNYYNILMTIRVLLAWRDLGSHTEHNTICNSIKVCIKTRLGLDYNFPWDEGPSYRTVSRKS